VVVISYEGVILLHEALYLDGSWLGSMMMIFC